VSHPANWKPDPYGIHELRFFSADGKPTLLVMDGGKTSYDKPPPDDPRPLVEAEARSPDHPVLDVAPRTESALSPPSPPSLSAPKLPTPPPPPAARPGLGQSEPSPAVVAADAVPRVSSALVNKHPGPDVSGQQSEPLGRPLKIAYGLVLGLLAVSALGVLYVHVHHAKAEATHADAATTTVVTSETTTTTAALPTAPKPSAEDAADSLISSWSTSNRSAALTVATPTAVSTLFAATYSSGLAIDRGCSTSFTPIVCTFGPPGGASPNDPIYQVLVSQAPAGWYVSTVKIEN
jgi:hypothetical protein